jgi:hypothetical protein
VSNGSSQRAIRVTLCFGSHSDLALVRALRELRPYARAKLLRKLIREGLRLRLRSLGFVDRAPAPRTDSSSAISKGQSMSPLLAEPFDISGPATDAATEPDSFSESVLDELGKTVK